MIQAGSDDKMGREIDEEMLGYDDMDDIDDEKTHRLMAWPTIPPMKMSPLLIFLIRTLTDGVVG